MQPPIYLINLDSSPDRLEKCTQRLKKQNVIFSRIAGVLGASLSQAEVDAHYSASLNRKRYHRPLSAGEIGCYYSHRKAWECIASGDADYGIVLEDDISITGNLLQAFDAIAEIPVDWGLIKLAPYRDRTRKIVFRHPLKHNFDLVIHNKPMSGGAATAITKDAAKKLLSSTVQFGRPVDVDIQCSWETGVNVLSLMPYPIAQDLSYDSTIKEPSKRIKSSFLLRKQQQLVNGLMNREQVKKHVREFKHALQTSTT